MKSSFRCAFLLGPALVLTSCETVPPAELANSPQTAQGRSFARSSCGGCHSIELYGTSSNPNAPPFGAIANQEGLTAATLSHWLRGAHNYPDEMDFYLRDAEVDALVAYMLTLRVSDYRRPPD